MRRIAFVAFLSILSLGLITGCGSNNPILGEYELVDTGGGMMGRMTQAAEGKKIEFASSYMKGPNRKTQVERYEIQRQSNQVKIWVKTNNGNEKAVTVEYEDGGNVIYFPRPMGGKIKYKRIE